MSKTPKTTDKKSHYMFYLILALPIIFWACAFPFIRVGLQELSPTNLTILRLSIACIAFLLLRILLPQQFSKPLHKRDILPIFLLGFLGIVVYHLGLNYGEQYISASAASLIIATIPIFVVIFAVIYLKETITIKILIGIILSLLGVIIISVAGQPGAILEITYLSGALTVLIAAFMGAGYTIAGKKMLERYSALSLTTYAFLFGSLGLIPFFNISFVDQITTLSLIGWSAVIFLGLFSTVVGYVLWLVALERLPASKLSVYLYFIPVLSTSISCLFFQEQITIFFLLGGAIIIAGLYIVNTKKRVP